MKHIIVIIISIFLALPLYSQNEIENVLKEIETNSTTLAALRQQMEAQKLGNRTGIFPANPEVEFNYLWGNPSAMGNRTDFSVKQSFDFPTAYAYHGKISDLQNTNVEFAYKSERLNLLLAAKQICIELIYKNALLKEYAVRLQNAEHIANSYKAKYENGDANILENNKSQLNLATVQSEITTLETERANLLSQLKSLNGGKDIYYELLITNYDDKSSNRNLEFVISNFEDWYATAETKNPALQYLKGKVQIQQQEVKLQNSLWLPKFSAGYMSEKVVGQHFQGVSVGISIPLWENKNTVKQAQLAVKAQESLLADNKLQIYNRLQNLHTKAAALQQNAQKIRQSLANYNNAPLLQKALDAGEISLLEYLLETEYYYAAISKLLEAEREYQLAVAELEMVEL